MIQTTGKANYQTVTNEHKNIWKGTEDFTKTPDLLSDEIYAVRSALIFWTVNNLDKKAEKDVSKADVDGITSVVNNSTNSREARFNNLKNIMKLDNFKECIK
jgi:predicted chitinase